MTAEAPAGFSEVSIHRRVYLHLAGLDPAFPPAQAVAVGSTASPSVKEVANQADVAALHKVVAVELAVGMAQVMSIFQSRREVHIARITAQEWVTQVHAGTLAAAIDILRTPFAIGRDDFVVQLTQTHAAFESAVT